LRLAIVGSDDHSGLGASYARAATSLGHDARLVTADELIAGARRITVCRRFRTETLVTRPLLRRLRTILMRIGPSLIIVIKGRYLPRHWIESLRASLDAPILNYYPDHPLWPGYTDRQIREALFAYDEVLTWSDSVAERLIAHGLERVRVIPFGYDPHLYSAPSHAVEPQWDASLIGQFYPSRLPFVLAIADRKLIVSGRGWRRGAAGTPLRQRVQERTYGGNEVCRIYWKSKAVLNILAPPNASAHNMRTFEIPATRTVMITTRSPEHEALFGDGGAILVESPAEARSALMALENDPDRRLAIAEEGHRRISGHTYSDRMASLLDIWLPRDQ
jgi:spore maturation protein CgeB